MFHGVPIEVLQQLSEAAAVGSQRQRASHVEGRTVGLDAVPAPLGDRRQVDRFGIGRAVALPGEGQQVVQQVVHPLVHRGDAVEVVLVALDEFEMAAGDLQRIAEVVTDDRGEPIEPFVLGLQSLSLLFERRLPIQPRQRSRRVGDQQFGQFQIVVVELIGRFGDGLEDAALADRDAEDAPERPSGLRYGIVLGIRDDRGRPRL